jgi:hypothetical protein
MQVIQVNKLSILLLLVLVLANLRIQHRQIKNFIKHWQINRLIIIIVIILIKIIII